MNLLFETLRRERLSELKDDQEPFKKFKNASGTSQRPVCATIPLGLLQTGATAL
jgi:hypothetical protein